MKKNREKLVSPQEAASEPSAGHEFEFRLYVTGPSSVSARAVVNARKICEDHLKGRYRLEILNVADNIALATRDQIVAAPTLIKLSPLPLKRFIGDMSNSERLIKGLDVHTAVTT